MKEMEPEDNEMADFWIGLLYGLGTAILLWSVGVVLWILLVF